MNKTVLFRTWFYFRNGWSLYFAFIMAAINTLTVTYYLAIEKYPILKEIFPTFIAYVAIITVVGIPLLVAIGYAHMKKSPALRSEVDVSVESNPYQRRIIVNSEIMLELNLKLLDLLIKLSKNEKIDELELEKLSNVCSKLHDFTNERTYYNKKDLEFLMKNILNQK